MALIVQKYGGTSVGDAERIKRVAERVVEAADSGQRICIVVSAMGHTTDELMELASQITPEPFGRELDMLLTAGERISMALLTMAINELGRRAISFTGSQAGIVTFCSRQAIFFIGSTLKFCSSKTRNLFLIFSIFHCHLSPRCDLDEHSTVGLP